jgi:hypothetical protein
MIGLRKRKAYDFHDINPEAYDLRAGKGNDIGKPASKTKGTKAGGAAAGGGGEPEGEGEDAKKAAGPLPGFENDDTEALLKAKASGLAVNKQQGGSNAMATAMEHI